MSENKAKEFFERVRKMRRRQREWEVLRTPEALESKRISERIVDLEISRVDSILSKTEDRDD